MSSHSDGALFTYHCSFFLFHISCCSFHRMCISTHRSQYSLRFPEMSPSWLKPKHCTHPPQGHPIKEWSHKRMWDKGTMHRVSFESKLQFKCMQSCCIALFLH